MAAGDQPPVPGGTTAIRGGAYVREDRTPGVSKCVFCGGDAVSRVWDVGPVCSSWGRRVDHSVAALWAMAHGRISENVDHPDWDALFNWHRDETDTAKALVALSAIEREVEKWR